MIFFCEMLEFGEWASASIKCKAKANTLPVVNDGMQTLPITNVHTMKHLGYLPFWRNLKHLLIYGDAGLTSHHFFAWSSIFK